jgi:hypothetical protein
MGEEQKKPIRMNGQEKVTMNWQRILIVSACLNAGLLVAWGVLAQRKSAAHEAVQAVKTVPTVKPKPVKKGSDAPLAVAASTQVTELNFDWKAVESEDFKQYIANLRAIGCPELTIQDIILAELDYIYEPKMNALKGLHVPVPVQKFWRDNAPSPNPVRAPNADEEIKRLFDERKALVKELLGKEEKPMRSANNYYEDTAQSRHAFLSAENVEKMHQLEAKYEKLGGALAKEVGYKSEGARQSMLEEMRTFMTPEEVYEYEIRTSNLTRQLRNSLKAAQPTEAEFRAIFAANYEAHKLALSGKAEPQEVKAAQLKAEEALKTTLGEERFTEMERSKDYGYRQLMAAGSFLGYDKAAALRVHDMRGETQKALQAVYANTGLSPEQQSKAITDIRTATEKTIERELGPSGAKYYLKTGGSWIRRLGPQNTLIPAR